MSKIAEQREGYIKALMEYTQEPSIPSNLDEVAKRYESYYDVGEEHGYLYTHRGDIAEAFKDGAEWIYAQISNLPDNLDEAAEEFSDGEWDGLHDEDGMALYTEDMIQYAFKEGAKWMAEQYVNPR